MNYRSMTRVLAATVVLATAMPAMAAEHEVRMLDAGSDGGIMVFEPAFLQIEPGDTVNFVATAPYHNSESIEGMVPEGAEAWAGEFSAPISVTLTVEGVYGYKCLPHYGMGMVGVIQVGASADNLEATRAVEHPEKAAEQFDALFEQVSN